jgi:hypothetical protein
MADTLRAENLRDSGAFPSRAAIFPAQESVLSDCSTVGVHTASAEFPGVRTDSAEFTGVFEVRNTSGDFTGVYVDASMPHDINSVAALFPGISTASAAFTGDFSGVPLACSVPGIYLDESMSIAQMLSLFSGIYPGSAEVTTMKYRNPSGVFTGVYLDVSMTVGQMDSLADLLPAISTASADFTGDYTVPLAELLPGIFTASADLTGDYRGIYLDESLSIAQMLYLFSEIYTD